MFVAWALLSGLAGDRHLADFPEDIPSLRNRSTTPGAFFLSCCDGKFTNEDLNEEGNAFALAYFDFKNGQYLKDYGAAVAGDLPTLYHVPDTWLTYEKLQPVLDQRLMEWRAHGS